MRFIQIGLFLLWIASTTRGFGQDYVIEALDSLTNVYYFSKLEFDNSMSKNKSEGIVRFEDEEYRLGIDRLNKNFPFKLVYNNFVKKYIDNYLKNYKSVATIVSSSNYYFPIYEEYLLKYSLPLELKYLSVIESALNPTAKSHCGAAGLWQFMPATGKAYGLNINSYVDERYNISLATDAACRHLKDLYGIYNDWALAIAAYNCGAGNVNKAIKRAGGRKDFFGIMNYLPKETQGYVPAYMAVVYILNNLESHNIPSIKSKLSFFDVDYIEIKKPTTIKNLASSLRMKVEELKYLNPCFYIGVIPGNNDKVVVPKKKAMDFIDQEVKDYKVEGKENSGVKDKNIFGTIEVKSKDLGNDIIEEVVLCEVLNDYDYKTNPEIRVRNLNSTKDEIEANSIFIGRTIQDKSKRIISFYSVLNNNRSINYHSEFVEQLQEGATIYLYKQK